VLVIGLWWASGTRHGADESRARGAQTPAAGEAAQLEAAQRGAAPTASESARAELPVLVESAPEPFSLPARVRGRVLDALGRAVAGARVELAQSMESPERHRQDPDGLLRQDGAVQALAKTDARGEFELESPALRCESALLVISADPMLARLVHAFALEPGDRLLVAGEQDLGDLVLVSAGVIRGRFVDEGALFGADVSVSARASRGLVRVVRSDLGSSGEFELPHCEAGRHSVEARAGWMSAAEVDVHVESGRVSWVELVSPKRSGPIRGQVIKRVPDPMASLRVWGRPSDPARTVSAAVRADGSFELELQVDELHELVAGRAAEAPDWEIDPRQTAPGDRDVSLAVCDWTEIEIVALDAESGAPIPRFDFDVPNVMVGEEQALSFDSRLGAQGRGILRTEWRSTRLRCFAPAYLPFRGDIRLDAGSGSRMTVRLERGASIAGRVLGVSHPQVLLRRAYLGKQGPRAFSPHNHDVSDFLAPQQRAVGDEQGNFALRGLPAGTFELVIHGEHGMVRIGRLRLEQGEQRTLGELALAPYASLAGRVECAGAPCPSGLFVELEGQPRRGALVGLDGSFRLDGVEAGERVVLIKDYARAQPQLAQRSVELASGELELVHWTLAPP
jgi:hypothetical protein